MSIHIGSYKSHVSMLKIMLVPIIELSALQACQSQGHVPEGGLCVSGGGAGVVLICLGEQVIQASDRKVHVQMNIHIVLARAVQLDV